MLVQDSFGRWVAGLPSMRRCGLVGSGNPGHERRSGRMLRPLRQVPAGSAGGNRGVIYRSCAPAFQKIPTRLSIFTFRQLRASFKPELMLTVAFAPAGAGVASTVSISRSLNLLPTRARVTLGARKDFPD